MHIAFYDPSRFEALVDAFTELGEHYFAHDAPDKESVRIRLANDVLGPASGVRLVLACDQDKVAALATVSILYPAPGNRGQLFMKDLYVCSAWRSKGLGEQLMQFLANYALSTGCVRFDWTTESTNPGAMSFYERLGAKQVREKVYFRLTAAEIQALAGKSMQDTVA